MSSPTLTTIQAQMNFYAFPIVMVLGCIGNIFIFIIFSRQHQNACSIYLMHSAITNLLYLLIIGFLQIFSVSYYDQTLGALILCKFANYIPNFLGQVAITILILACIDRYMITSQRAAVRAFSTPKRAKYFIFFSYIFWLVFASHTAIGSVVNNGRCTANGIYATIYTFYVILIVGLIPSAILCVFAYLTYRNLRQLHRRVQPTEEVTGNMNNSIQRHDRNLLVFVLAEVIVYVITTSLFPTVRLEMAISGYVMPKKSLQYFRTEIFALNVGILLLFIFSAAPFYIYMISSKSFRRDVKQLIMNTYWKMTRKTSVEAVSRANRTLKQRETRV